MRNHIIFYLVTLLVFGGSIFLALEYGKILEKEKLASTQTTVQSTTTTPTTTPSLQPTPTHKPPPTFIDEVKSNLTNQLCLILLQIVCIVMLSRILNFVLKKMGQPLVIGEILAGILLGPSLISTMFPQFSDFLFPKHSLGNIQLVSQIGLIFFMFTVGLELNAEAVKKRIRAAVVISHASIIVPYFLGVMLSLFLYKTYAPKDISFLAFALFMGIAMSITAFPVLARIVQERGLSDTFLGSIAITCAAVDDISAWTLLALVVAVVKSASAMSAFYTVLCALIFIFFMLYVVKPALNKFTDKQVTNGELNRTVVTWFVILISVSALFAEIIGIHALFGGFLAGVIIPGNSAFKKMLRHRVEDFCVVFLLPLFFAFTGLRTQIGFLTDINNGLVCVIIILIAIAGKFLSSAIAARFTGLSWKDSFSLGALMNTRGLVELVVLNIGYDLGILSPEVFTMLVIMALVTTFMTGPLLSFIASFKEQPQEQHEQLA